MINWVAIFNRLFEIINQSGDVYYGGSRFLNVVREVTYRVPSYTKFIEERRSQGLSTSRRDYYYDLLMEQDESDRIAIVSHILDSVEHLESQRVSRIRELLGTEQVVEGPQAEITNEIWNADRLIEYLERMDNSIGESNYEHTLTLAYTCLEGFYKSFIRERIDENSTLDDLTRMSVEIRNHIEAELNANGIQYPRQVVTLISTVTNAICNARNNFSDSHSGNRAEKWLAVYARDNVNSIVKLLMNFI
jgi:hypothetical protein